MTYLTEVNYNMPRLSESTVETINNLNPADLVARGALNQIRHKAEGDRQDEYICPNPACQNGTGSDRTGITAKKGADGHFGYHCFNCGEDFDNLKILALHYGLDTKHDFQELVRRACEDFNITFTYEDGSVAFEEKSSRPRRPNQPPPPSPVAAEKKISDDELKMIQADLLVSTKPLESFFGTCGWRGLPVEFLLKYGCRYVDDWVHTKTRLNYPNYKDFATPTPRMLIPHDGGYLARLTCAIKQLDKKTQAQFVENGGKFLKAKMHAGNKGIFNPSAFESKLLFVVEGEVDAMSIEFCGYHACAVGGCGEWRLVVEKLKSMPADKWPRIIILFDSDEQGKKRAPEFKAALDKLGCRSVMKFFFDDKISKYDFNDLLREQNGEMFLRDLLGHFVAEAEAEFAAKPLPTKTDTKSDATGSAFEGDCTHSPRPDDSCLPFDDDERKFYFGGSATNKGDGQRLERFCGDRVKFLFDEERFLIFEDGVWTRRTNSKHNVVPYCFKLADRMRATLPFMEAEFEKDSKAKKHALAKIYAFENRNEFNAAISAFVGLDSIRITAKDLDEHEQLLNTKNGVVDLESGRLMDASPNLYLTQQCSVAYDKRADSSFVEKFFADVLPDEDTRRGLLRWLGYCLTGSTRDENFLCWLGSGRNGKGSTSKMVLRLLGNYATSLPTDALLKGRPKDSNAATTALNGLCKARFAISEELPQGGLVDSSLIKNLTGGDELPFRPLYGEFRRVAPTHKINLSGNFTPRLENFSDKGLRARLLVMPFDQTFTGDRCDSHLKEKLLSQENLRGLLKILVEEARLWYRDGLVISDRMMEATRENIEANDFVADFLSEYVEVTKDTRDSVPRKTLLELFKDKCPQTRRFNDRELSKLVVDKLSEQGVEFGRGKGGSYKFKGIRLVQND